MNTTRKHFAFLPAFLLLASLVARAAEPLTLAARSRSETARGSGEFRVVETNLIWDAHKTALVICDMWDRHTCAGATRRVAEMAPRLNEVVLKARAQGVFIIHCPSDTMKFYEGTPGRQLAQAAPVVTPKVPLARWCSLDQTREPALPIDDSDGGCDTDAPHPKGAPYPWTRQIATIEVHAGDAITDSAEAYYLMQQRGIENVIVAGVHLNMCVLGRPFTIRQMIKQGKNVALLRDLTDTMYNPQRAPYVPHCVGTDLMIEHVEKYWCPSITSAAFLGGEPFRFREDRRPRVVFMIGEDEYKTAETLPAFAKKELEWRGIRCDFAHVSASDPNDFPGLDALRDADLLFLSVRRRTPARAQMELIRRHLAAGKPLVGIRTASHSFGAKPKDDQHEGWDSFDDDVLGGDYQNHYGKTKDGTPSTIARIIPGAAGHPVLTGVTTNELPFMTSLYRSRNLAPSVTPLMNAHVPGREEIEPVAWVNTNQNRRVFYTSLGGPEDFQQTAFRRLLLNGVLWTLNQPVPPAGAVQ